MNKCCSEKSWVTLTLVLGDKVKGCCVLWTMQSQKQHLYTYHGDRRESLSTSASAMSLGCELETTVYSDVPLLSNKSISKAKVDYPPCQNESVLQRCGEW